MYISCAIELCGVSGVVLHYAATLMWINSFYFISLTAACAVKTGFKVKGILYGMQRQPSHGSLSTIELEYLHECLSHLPSAHCR